MHDNCAHVWRCVRPGHLKKIGKEELGSFFHACVLPDLYVTHSTITFEVLTNGLENLPNKFNNSYTMFYGHK